MRSRRLLCPRLYVYITHLEATLSVRSHNQMTMPKRKAIDSSPSPSKQKSRHTKKWRDRETSVFRPLTSMTRARRCLRQSVSCKFFECRPSCLPTRRRYDRHTSPKRKESSPSPAKKNDRQQVFKAEYANRRMRASQKSELHGFSSAFD